MNSTRGRKFNHVDAVESLDADNIRRRVRRVRRAAVPRLYDYQLPQMTLALEIGRSWCCVMQILRWPQAHCCSNLFVAAGVPCEDRKPCTHITKTGTMIRASRVHRFRGSSAQIRSSVAIATGMLPNLPISYSSPRR